MRPRIKARVNVQMVVESLEHKRAVYSEAIQNVMKEENLKYSEAKKLLNLRLREKAMFKF
jgi:ABC-type tungstate transport system permease subunit